ncbi:MAG TPA: ABC transporter ATP-binding protein [Stellaceae bacterium]|jgi:branched-chain amino acid transport system ATP-binding protein|nr:ABC transporter ATP-binding protein [Stellaceae bacterium]
MVDLLRLDDVTAGYRDTVVLERISVGIAANEAWALLGRNGVGKTTLLMTVMGLTNLNSGAVVFDQRDIAALDTHRRVQAGIGYVPQEREIFPSLTVDENLRVARRAGEWTRERVYDLFPRLAERRRNYGNQLSGGEQQMLAVGRALVGNPRLLLLDEPFEGLAPVIIDTLAAALTRLRSESNIATVLVEQQVEIALEMTEKVLVLDKGQIVFQGESLSLAADRERLASLVGLQEAEAPR